MSDTAANIIIIGFPLIGLVFATYQFSIIAGIQLTSHELGDSDTEATGLTKPTTETTKKLIEIYEAISTGAEAFLRAEYTICVIFSLIFGVVIMILTASGSGDGWDWTAGVLTMIAFLLGAATSILSGYIGMKVAVYSNARTTVAAQRNGWTEAFNTAFRAGGVMGFALTSLGILVLYGTLGLYSLQYQDKADWSVLMDCISGYGLGGSSIAMFGRVGGGIYTKAADVGADLVGKVECNLPEDDPRNPATIADNVGDNVGDVAGMGADLFGSFAESTCAALVIATVGSGNDYLYEAGGWSAVMFPLLVSSAGIMVCLICSFVATHIWTVKQEGDIETVLKVQLILTTLLMLPVSYGLAEAFLPSSFYILKVYPGTGDDATDYITGSPVDAFVCITCGCLGGLLIGLITEYYTSHSYKPVRELAKSCTTGAATNVIYGLALGYLSCIAPVFILAIIIFVGFDLLDMYGVALGAIGMLSTLATGLTIDAYGPVCDNAGGIAEMALSDFPEVRAKTDALDAAGNTTAAIGKGFAIGSAALVSLALFGAFAVRAGINTGVPLLEPLTFAFLMIGANLPYWFSALTMKSVGTAAMEMVHEVQRQVKQNPALLDENTTERPDYESCIAISTKASLREMVAPAILVMAAPLVTGIFFGVYAVCGLLAGGLSSGVQLAISMSNTGGAWDNAKKFIEKSGPDTEYGGKGSDPHKAAVIGDTVGDPLKDTSGPALNILMKLMAILSLVFADFFVNTSVCGNGEGLFGLGQSL